jgi:hypothetical protein
MKARHQITLLLKQWLQLTHKESHSLQLGRSSELAKIQRAKDLLQQPLTEALEHWKLEEPQGGARNLIRHEINRLRDLESQHSDLLAVRKREVREKILLLEQSLHDLAFHSGCAETSKAA